MEDASELFLPKSHSDYKIHGDELRSFRSCLKWLCADQSNPWKASLSWSVFFLFTIGVPLLSHFLLVCPTCDLSHRRPYNAIVQLSLSAFATLSFISLSSFTRKYGLLKFLFLDKLSGEREKVQQGYTYQLHRSLKLLLIFVLPCFAAVTAYKIWWYITAGTAIPYYFGNVYVSDAIACSLQLCSWLYRKSMFLFVCVLFRLICYLQILRLEDFAEVFRAECDVGYILKDHLRIRRNLRTISHRFRAFILFTMILVTANQLASLVLMTKNGADVSFFKAGELALCSIILVTALCICLRSATKITHRAQSIACLAAKWHICATINSFDMADGDMPTAQIPSSRIFPACDDSESDDEEKDEDDLDTTKMFPIYAHTWSFQKRQALVTYLENNKAGITVYGFTLDRTWLHTMFGIQLSLVLWILSKTVGIS